jgi:membrane protein YdbS with pleckstrin-like domain
MWSSPHERVVLEQRRHGVVLVRPFVRALALAGLGAALSWLGGPLTIPGALLLAAGAAVALRAAWAWETTRFVVTTEKLYVAYGSVRRRAAAVRLTRAGAIEIEQGLLGRLLRYGTVIAGDLEIDFVPHPEEVWRTAGGVGRERRPHVEQVVEDVVEVVRRPLRRVAG